MSKRHFPNWIDSYLDYAKDGFCPDSFHLWTALTTISGVLERKVWLKDGKILYRPNIFTLLVGYPGTGKSTALERGVWFIEEMKNSLSPNLKVMSGVMTQAGLCTEMEITKAFDYRGMEIKYSSGFYHASEASESGLQQLSGDFNATITALYDCAPHYRKRLRDKSYNIPSPSFAMIAGSTFEFLRNIINENSVMGGLASRFTYVVSKERREQKPGFQGAAPEIDKETRFKLLQDLFQIHQMVGKFRIDRAAYDLHTDWFIENDKKFLMIESERMQSIMTRKPTLLKKLMMICSAAERSDLSITREHVERAIELTEAVTKDTPMIISSAVIANKNTPEAVYQFIGQTVKKMGNCAGLDMKYLRGKYLSTGGDPSKLEATLTMMIAAGKVSFTTEANPKLQLHFDPDNDL